MVVDVICAVRRRWWKRVSSPKRQGNSPFQAVRPDLPSYSAIPRVEKGPIQCRQRKKSYMEVESGVSGKGRYRKPKGAL